MSRLLISCALLALSAHSPSLAQSKPDAGFFPEGAREFHANEQYEACPVGSAVVALPRTLPPSNPPGSPPVPPVPVDLPSYSIATCLSITNQPTAVVTVTPAATPGSHQYMACPPNHYLRGIAVKRDKLLCSTNPGLSQSPVVTITGTSNTCFSGQLAVGIRAGGVLLCSSAGLPTSLQKQ